MPSYIQLIILFLGFLADCLHFDLKKHMFVTFCTSYKLWLVHTIVVWCIVATLFYFFSRDLLVLKRPSRHTCIIFFICTFIALSLSMLVFTEHRFVPKFITEYRFFAGKYGTGAFIIEVIEQIYYLLESLLVLFTAISSQNWGDTILKDAKLPWASFGLVLIWGLIHIVTQGLSNGIIISIISFVLGILYLMFNRNQVLFYIFVYVCVFLL